MRICSSPGVLLRRCYLMAVHSGHTDIEEDHLGALLNGDANAVLAVARQRRADARRP